MSAPMKTPFPWLLLVAVVACGPDSSAQVDQQTDTVALTEDELNWLGNDP